MEDAHSLTLIVDIVIIIVASLLFGIFAHILKQSVILAYILVGILIGPYGLGLISNIEEVTSLAEIGVALLMFIIGLEFRFSTLSEIWKISIIGGIIQIATMVILGYLLSRIFGWPIFDSVILGMIVSISSTMIVVKLLSERNEIEYISGKIMIGILIVQDLAVIIMIFFISNFKEIARGDILDLLRVLVLGMGTVFGIILIGRKLLPKVMYLVVRTGNKEIFLLSVFAVAIGGAISTHLLGLSIALGAFVVGFLLSEAEYNLEISLMIRPLRDLFIVIFFVSIGMFINPGILLDNIALVGYIILLILIGKFVTCSLPTWFFGYDGKTSFKVGMGMMQVGEFSFVLLTIGQKYGYLQPALTSSIITSALITIILTPLAMGQSERLYDIFSRKKFLNKVFNIIPRLSFYGEKEEILQPTNHLILCGYGRSGSHLVMDLKGKYDITIIEHDPRMVHKIKEAGLHYLFGDAINHHILIKANIARAKILILAIPDEKTKKIAIRYAKVYNPEIFIIVRARDEKQAQELLDLGADEALVPEILWTHNAIDRIIQRTAEPKTEGL
ncbi:MAG: cation:proton antiporter [Candidatus Scalinduaceae bacterium]